MCLCVSLCEYHFHRFRFVKRSEKHAFSQAVVFTICRLWASSQAGASHPFHVTLGSGLASVSWRGTKCLACVYEAWCGANCPSQVHQSIVGSAVHDGLHVCQVLCRVSACLHVSFKCVYVWRRRKCLCRSKHIYVRKDINVLYSSHVHRM